MLEFIRRPYVVSFAIDAAARLGVAELGGSLRAGELAEFCEHDAHAIFC